MHIPTAPFEASSNESLALPIRGARRHTRGCMGVPRISVLFARHPVLALLVSIVTALALPGLCVAANQTPKKLNAIIFGPHPSAADFAPQMQQALCAEHYTVDMDVNGVAGNPTFARLKQIAGQSFAVLVLITHGSENSLSVEDCATEAIAVAKRNQYRADPANAWIKDYIDWGTVSETDNSGRTTTRYSVGITDVGLYRLFGGTDANRSIMLVLACHSWELQQKHPNTGTFGATEFLGLEGAADNKDFARGKAGLMAMGGVEGIPHRPVVPAFDGRMKHMGPGNTTLAPACTGHMPADDSVLPLKVKTPGSTMYETTMNTSSIQIMEPQGCKAAISAETWTDNLNHIFKVEPTEKGRLILKVKPTAAISANNNDQLIGNLYLPGDYDDERVEVNECPFGQSGLDGYKPCVAPEIPFRWCVWCGNAPAQPAHPKAPQSTEESSFAPRLVPFGETDAFVLYQDSPGAGNSFVNVGMPANMNFLALDDWYGHVLFTPDASQVGQQFDVTFGTFDVNGPRAQRTFQWRVVSRLNGLTLHGPDAGAPAGELGLVSVRPGEPADFTIVVENSGNTLIQQLSIDVPGLSGAGFLPVTVSPSYYDALEPGDRMSVHVHVDTPAGQASGIYSGLLTLTGMTADGALSSTGSYQLQIDQPPVIASPAETLHVVVGMPLSVPIGFFDPDGDPLTTYLDIAPFGGRLQSAEGGATTFEWTPPAAAAGLNTFAIVARDGQESAARSLFIEVHGVLSVPNQGAPFAFAVSPSPARSSVRFALTLEREAQVDIGVFDPGGRLVARPVHDERVGAGHRTWTWKPDHLESGIYFVHVTAGSLSEQRRLIWLGGGAR